MNDLEQTRRATTRATVAACLFSEDNLLAKMALSTFSLCKGDRADSLRRLRLINIRFASLIELVTCNLNLIQDLDPDMDLQLIVSTRSEMQVALHLLFRRTFDPDCSKPEGVTQEVWETLRMMLNGHGIPELVGFLSRERVAAAAKAMT